MAMLEVVFKTELPPGWTLKQLKEQLEAECDIDILRFDYAGSSVKSCYCLIQEEEGLKGRLVGLYRTVAGAKITAQETANQMSASSGWPPQILDWRTDAYTERCWANEETEFFIFARDIAE